MPVSIADIHQASNLEWDTCWQDCDYATYFQSREWMETWRKLDGGGARLEPRAVEFSDGKRAIIPICTKRIHRGLVKTHSLSIGDACGGWLSADRLNLDHALLLSRYVIRLGSINWLTNPSDPLVLNCGMTFRKTDETHIVGLRNGIESIIKKWSKGHRSAVQKAVRSGVSVRRAITKDDWSNYYTIYRDSIRRWGDSATSDHGPEIFEALWRLDSPNVVLWLAMHRDEPIAGAVCLYAKRQVSYWHGAAFESHFELRPVNLLMHEVIRDACMRDKDWFDLGLSGGHDGVRSFKKSFGADPVASNLMIETTNWHRMISRAASLKDRVLAQPF